MLSIKTSARCNICPVPACSSVSHAASVAEVFFFFQTDLWGNCPPQVWLPAWICSRWKSRRRACLGQANEQETAEIYNKIHLFFSWWNIRDFVCNRFKGLNPNLLTIGHVSQIRQQIKQKQRFLDVDLIFYLNERNFLFVTKMYEWHHI